MAQARNEMFSFQLQKEACMGPFRATLFCDKYMCLFQREQQEKLSHWQLKLGKKFTQANVIVAEGQLWKLHD